jgi:hypothetical protein
MKDSTNLSFVQGYYYWYDSPQDVEASYWLRNFISPMQPLCADWDSTTHSLVAYGGRNQNDTNLALILEEGRCTFSGNDYVYFSEFNTLYNSYGYRTAIPISKLQARVAAEERIYSGGATIYGA